MESKTTRHGRLVAHLRSNVIAYLALFFAFGGGTALAATSIGSAQLAPIDVHSHTVTVPHDSSGYAYATCPKGQKLIGEAAYWQDSFTGNDDDPMWGSSFVVSQSGGTLHPVGYMAEGRNQTGASQKFTVQISCLTG
jgi:hypothetical protein